MEPDLLFRRRSHANFVISGLHIPYCMADDSFVTRNRWNATVVMTKMSVRRTLGTRCAYMAGCTWRNFCSKTSHGHNSIYSESPWRALSNEHVTNDSIASTGIRSEVEMKYVDLVPGDPVGGQIYQFNARIGNLPLPFFFYCTEYVCIKSFSDISCRWITWHSQKTLFTMPRCPCGVLLPR